MFHQHHYNQSPLRDRRLIFAEPTINDLDKFIHVAEFEDKVKENYDKKTTELAKKIEALEKAGKKELEIKEELKNEQDKICTEAFNQALRDMQITYVDNGKKTQVTYLMLANHSDTTINAIATKIFTNFKNTYTADVDKAVDQYTKEKIAATGKTKTALADLPAPSERIDLDSANPETARLQEIVDKNRGLRDQFRAQKEAFKSETDIAYKGRTNDIDEMTNPEGGMIDDFDDGLWGKETDFTSYTRARLNGYLYANDIFAGSGEAGRKAVQEAIKKPYELFHGTTGNRLDMDDLTEGMELQNYFEEAKKYTQFSEKEARFDRVIGTMAGLLKLTDDVIKDQRIHDAYRAYLISEFNKIGTNPSLKNDEEKQLQFLYKLQSFAEFINANPAWRTDFAKIEKRTDPDRDGDDVIDDYPDDGYLNVVGEDKNTTSPVRKALNGYLYSVLLFSGGNEKTVDHEYQRAFTMFEDVAGDMFEQEHLDRTSRGTDGDDDGFGLGTYATDAEAYSQDPTVKYAIAGLLKQTNDIADEKAQQNYRNYLTEKLKGITPGDSPEAHLTILSSIKSPEAAELDFKYTLHAKLEEHILEASRQHNQFTLDKKLSDELKKDPKVLSAEAYSKLATDIKTSIDTFVTKRADGYLKDLEKRFNLLLDNNSKLKSPLYSDTELQDLRQKVEANGQEFGKAKAVTKEGELDKAISGNYLQDLSEAEKEYFVLVDELDAKLYSIQEQAKGTEPDQTPPVLPPVVGGGAETGGEEVSESTGDSIQDNWSSAVRENPQMGDYVGLLIADSFSNTEKTDARDAKGKLIGSLENGEEVKRTAADAKIMARNVEGINFIRIHWRGKAVWSPEEQLFKKDDFENPGTPGPKTPQTPPSRPPETTPGQPRYATSHLDQIFDRVNREVDTQRGGTTFELTYNGKRTACRVERLSNGYHLITSHPEAGNANLTFRSVEAIRNYIESGALNQYMAMQTIMDRRNWDLYKHPNWLDKMKKIKRTGPYSMYVEFDWKRNNAFEKGNGKVSINVGPDGHINYSISKDYAGPNGENMRHGTAADFMQLIQALNHTKNWSENYKAYERTESFAAMQYRERLLSALMETATFKSISARIGEPYNFNHFDINGYAYMYLNWAGATDLVSRNRAMSNPILEVKLTAQNTIAWKMLRPSGAAGAWLGIHGNARDLNELARQVEGVRAQADTAMTVPSQNLPNLGNFGYTLY